MRQRELGLDGFDAGPLFAPPVKRRPPKRDPKCTKAPGRLRRAAERQATPAWADRASIRELFKQARRLTLATGVVHSVDHIVPLRHELVCGLHCAENLRVISLAENVRKSNTTWPDMPEAQTSLLPCPTLSYPACYPALSL